MYKLAILCKIIFSPSTLEEINVAIPSSTVRKQSMQAELPEGFVKRDICVIIYIHVKIWRVYRKEEKQKWTTHHCRNHYPHFLQRE